MHPRMSSDFTAAASGPVLEAAGPLAAAAAAVLPATGASWPPTTALGDGLASSSMMAERTHSMREPSLQLC